MLEGLEDQPKTVVEALDEGFAIQRSELEGIKAAVQGVQASVQQLIMAAQRGAGVTVLSSAAAAATAATSSAEQALEDMARTPPRQRLPQPHPGPDGEHGVHTYVHAFVSGAQHLRKIQAPGIERIRV